MTQCVTFSAVTAGSGFTKRRVSVIMLSTYQLLSFAALIIAFLGGVEWIGFRKVCTTGCSRHLIEDPESGKREGTGSPLRIAMPSRPRQIEMRVPVFFEDGKKARGAVCKKQKASMTLLLREVKNGQPGCGGSIFSCRGQ
jgi:hypothetical protein